MTGKAPPRNPQRNHKTYSAWHRKSVARADDRLQALMLRDAYGDSLTDEEDAEAQELIYGRAKEIRAGWKVVLPISDCTEED